MLDFDNFDERGFEPPIQSLDELCAWAVRRMLWGRTRPRYNPRYLLVERDSAHGPSWHLSGGRYFDSELTPEFAERLRRAWPIGPRTGGRAPLTAFSIVEAVGGACLRKDVETGFARVLDQVRAQDGREYELSGAAERVLRGDHWRWLRSHPDAEWTSWADLARQSDEGLARGLAALQALSADAVPATSGDEATAGLRLI